MNIITQTLLNVLVSDINTTLEEIASTDRLTITFEGIGGRTVGIQRITRTNKNRHNVDSKFILPDATFSEAHHYLVGFQNAMSFIPTGAMLEAIVEAENFISGFEDDTTQEGIPELLTKLRTLHPLY